MNKTRASILALVMMVAGTLLPGFATTQAAADIDVYTTPGTHTVNGRQWKTVCSKYSSTIERCRTEIWATQITLAKGRFTQTNGWAFNNLTYKPVKHSLWGSNPLANPGTWTEAGRQWKTECGTAVTGRDGCRSYIYSTVYTRSGSAYKAVNQWTFNNIVRMTPGSADFSPENPPPPKTPRENAIHSAKVSLEHNPYSRANLIEKLMSEGFARTDATYAVDSLKVDWNHQAVLVARESLAIQPNSRADLILELEELAGFTHAQAVFGVDAQNADWFSQATRAARWNLQAWPYSRAGLIMVLTDLQGFTQAQAIYGADSANSDWNAQAVRAAREALAAGMKTRDQVESYLLSRWFTSAEAEYGAKMVAP